MALGTSACIWETLMASGIYLIQAQLHQMRRHLAVAKGWKCAFIFKVRHVTFYSSMLAHLCEA